MQENLIAPSLSNHIEKNIKGYLNATFNFSDSNYEKVFNNFISSEEGILKGPFIDIKRPFKQASPGYSNPLEIASPFPPFEHQLKAFKNLSSNGKNPSNTLVVTGTGSGKTECFLIPIADHCLREKKKAIKGIKAIILYPMNALATDQAGRFSEFLLKDMKENIGNGFPLVTAGLFVGEDQEEKRKAHKSMGLDTGSDGEISQYHLIDDRSALHDNPPDILLTNYKMLDYLLMKPEHKNLWSSNQSESPLKYLVLDEMHTFDGAQGSDVALLIRRLKAKLKLNTITCVGTSATLLGEMGGDQVLTTFASRLFGEKFSKNSIIPETRLSIDETFSDVTTFNEHIPTDETISKPKNIDNISSYIVKSARVWFKEELDDSLKLGSKVKSHKLLYSILNELDNKPVLISDLLTRINNTGLKLSKAQLYNFLSLLTHSKREVELGNNKKIEVPLLFVRTQLWVRELRRLIQSTAQETPSFHWFSSGNIPDDKLYLPPIYCEECGEHGLLLSKKGDHDFEWDISTIYENFATASNKVRYLFKCDPNDLNFLVNEDTGQLENNEILENVKKICPGCKTIENWAETERQNEKCPNCEQAWDYYRVHHSITESKRDKRECPGCKSRFGLRIIGSRVSVLSSVINSQIFLSKLNPKESKKLLVFSDSVQDASHRAGYYNARTYRFNLRTAIQTYLKESGKEIELADISQKFLDYWIGKLGEKKVVATFFPSDLKGANCYRALFENRLDDELKSELYWMLKRRIDWEFYLEYSLRSQVGRTLEKTLSSCIYSDIENFDGIIKELFLDLSNHYQGLRTAGEESFKHFIIGSLKRLLMRGAISLEVLEQYRKTDNIWYLSKTNLNKETGKYPYKWISNLPRGGVAKGSEVGSLPKFISTNERSNFFDLLGSPQTGESWFNSWVKRTIAPDQQVFPRIEHDRFLLEVFNKLSDLNIVNKLDGKNHTVNFGIPLESIKISSDLTQLQCDLCAQKIVIPKKQSSSYLNMSCIKHRCLGKISKELKANEDKQYYQKVYESGDIERIFAYEHTGLLSRKDREKVENEFKGTANRREDAINLLSCTPTLEMGIDVGDLSATVIASLPRAASNYQQQVGRAGRKSGCSLVVSIAQDRPRDLLYFQYPEQLIDGNVQAPGCFLDATDLLKRQILAYLLDNYLEVIQGTNEFKVSILVDEIRGKNKETGMLSNLIKLLKDNGEEILKVYQNSIKEDSTKVTWDSVTSFYRINEHGSSDFFDKLRLVLEQYQQSILDIEIKLGEIQPIINEFARKKNLSKEDLTKFRDAKRDKASLMLQKELIGGKDDVFKFLSRYGFLPNYAFQEDSIELTGIILDEQEDSKGKITTRSKETFVRPAKLGLRELAPGNTFYGGGYKLEISQVDVGSRRNKTLIENWRACPSCGHLERDKRKVASNCPSCDDHMWSDTGSKHEMLKLMRATAVTNLFSGVVADNKDDRDKKFFKVRSYFEIPKNAIYKSWAYEGTSFVFGMEFLSKMTLREINFGEDGAIENPVKFAGEELPDGFLVCDECGRVGKKAAEGKLKIRHTANCPHAKEDTRVTTKKDGSPLLIYREMQSEAIRLLLPISEDEAQITVASIKAAIMLGFRQKFGGQPLHLEISEQCLYEPNGNKVARRYLVIFDSVPGGTGFLRELWDKEKFFELIELSLNKLNTCKCNDNDMLNGCPLCILSGVSQFDIPYVERDEAKEYLNKIIEHKAETKEWEGSLDEVSVSAFYDSELEYKFLRLFKNCFDKDGLSKRLKESTKLDVEFKNLKRHQNTELYTFDVQIGENEPISYKMLAHKALGGDDFSSEADFYIECLSDTKTKPIAVYLDGYEYHGDKNSSNRCQNDFKIRDGLFNGKGCDQHIVWCLSWADVKIFLEGNQDQPNKNYLKKEELNSRGFWSKDSISQLFCLLAGDTGNPNDFRNHFLDKGDNKAIAIGEKNFAELSLLDPASDICEKVKDCLSTVSGPQIGGLKGVFKKNAFFLYGMRKSGDKNHFLSVVAFESPLEVRSGIEAQNFFERWTALLRTWNLLNLYSDEVVCKVWAEK
jgi:DEAD/DEAH box helicase domain-containing protein